MNLALLGAHHEDSGRQTEHRLNFISLTFKSATARETFDRSFRQYQELHRRRVDIYERETWAIRFPRDRG